MFLNHILILCLTAVTSSHAFVLDRPRTLNLSSRHGHFPYHCPKPRLHEQTPTNQQYQDSCVDPEESQIEVTLVACDSFGIDPAKELPNVLNAVASVCQEFGIQFEHDNIQANSSPLHPKTLPGVLGRVLLIHVKGVPEDFNVDGTELISQLKVYASEQIDDLLAEGGEYKQPIMLAFRNYESRYSKEDLIAQEIADYGLRDAISSTTVDKLTYFELEPSMFVPSKHVQIDGAFIKTMELPGSTHFDTSSVIVLDHLVSSDLRKRLLNVVKGLTEQDHDDWDDTKSGPNPNRWERGGLIDVVNEGSVDTTSDGSCWGLTTGAIEDICFNSHPAITEFESILSQLFSDFVVSRLPEAVFGDCISPLTANAPTHGDTFDYHIDADPLQVPPSPWADVFGRYPNRSRGKPRFISCLLYLNDNWEPIWGAPTRFLDPPTQEEVDIMPKPGRCVIMDQDISHTVVAPNAEAGKRPRYSLVWKLILHPKSMNQDMTDLSCGRSWPVSQVIGSARGE